MTNRDLTDVCTGPSLAGRLWRFREAVSFATSTVLLAGIAATVRHAGSAAAALWAAATLVGLLSFTASLLTAIRRRQPSVDVIAGWRWSMRCWSAKPSPAP
jgi:hypothetical protein